MKKNKIQSPESILEYADMVHNMVDKFAIEHLTTKDRALKEIEISYLAHIAQEISKR